MPDQEFKGRLLVVSCGDPGGIGTEILCAALNHLRGESRPPLLWALPNSLARMLLDHVPAVLPRPALKVWGREKLDKGDFAVYTLPDEPDWPVCETPPPPRVNILNGQIAQRSLSRATDLVLENPSRRALVTLPFHKAAMAEAGFRWPGHTEYLQERGRRPDSLMLLHSPEISVGLVTNHLPLDKLGEAITAERIRSRALLMLGFMKTRRIDEPLQVLGRDPHCGDRGAIGEFDSSVTSRIVRELGQEGHPVIGPLPADATLARARGRFLAMYHDQGLPVFKLLSGGRGVNITLGIPFFRVSPDHGTAFDIAGRGQADPSSLCSALDEASQLLSRH